MSTAQKDINLFPDFRVVGWDSDCGTFDWHPEIDKPLGEPKDESKRESWTCSREFEHASVFVNLV